MDPQINNSSVVFIYFINDNILMTSAQEYCGLICFILYQDCYCILFFTKNLYILYSAVGFIPVFTSHIRHTVTSVHMYMVLSSSCYRRWFIWGVYFATGIVLHQYAIKLLVPCNVMKIRRVTTQPRQS